MRSKTYKTHWSYLGPAIKRRELMIDFVLDILYLMEDDGIVPPLHVLNEVLEGGGGNGGMGPGTSWRPFKMKEEEYVELVEALLNLDVNSAKKTHPYVHFQKAVVDEDVASAENYVDWVYKKANKRKNSLSSGPNGQIDDKP
jgi:hypothetical protein